MPMKVVLHTAEQLKIARKADALHIDATGGVTRPPIYTNREVYLFSIVPVSIQTPWKCVSASDFVTERMRVEDILYWLSTF